MGVWWAWLFSLLGLFVTSLCISEDNEIYVWNKIALINESNDGKWLAGSFKIYVALWSIILKTGHQNFLCHLLAYLKTKKNDLITTYAKRWTTLVHYLKSLCDRRYATMSFIYCSNVWVINLGRKGYWITESEQKIEHCPTHYVCWGQCGFKTFRPSVREHVFVEYSFILKERSMFALILCCYLYYYLP